MLNIEDFTVEDLTRAFFREFLIQNRFGKTFEAFQSEDVRSHQKIPKAVLIKQLCLEHLIGMNKKLDKPYKSLAEILVHYLKNKFMNKQKENTNIQKQQPQIKTISFPNYEPAKQQPVHHQPIQPLAVEQKQNPYAPSRVTTMRRIVKKQKQQQINVTVESKQEDTSTKESILDTKAETTIKNHNKIEQSKPQSIFKPVLNSLEPSLPKPTNKLEEIFEVKEPQIIQPEKKLMMFGKRKVEPKYEQPKEYDIFKNKQPEVEKILKPKYTYQKIDLTKMNIENPIKLQLSFKKPNILIKAGGKKKQKSIPYDLAANVRKILYQGMSKGLPKAWCQGILLSPFESTYYGLQQLEGGPCGIIASLQCYYLKHLLYLCPSKNPNLEMRENCVISAMSELLYKLNPNKITLALPAVATTYSNEAIPIQNIEILVIPNIKSIEQVYEQIYQYKTNFMGKSNHGYTLLLYSCILTKGYEEILMEMDTKENALIGNHGHCTQELVNMFITGKASTNCFDGIKTIGEGIDTITLKGIQQTPQFGFLTIFQTLGYIEVGRRLKSPTFPIWVICKQFHYHVVFANHYLISLDNDADKFDIVYFDGLYNCADRLVLTFTRQNKEPTVAVKDLPLIEQVLMTKWGRRSVDWNGSTKIL